MTVQTKTIGRMPTDHGPYDPQLAYGKKYQCELFGCMWESLHDNNNTAPAVWDGGDIITPNLVDWKKASGSYEAWLMNKDKPATTGTTGDYPYNGMGRVKLAKNIVNGVNTLTQDMFYTGAVGARVPNTNTIFVIQYDYVLGEDITIPANCVLEFDGGSLSGAYTITGQNTVIHAAPVKILGADVTLEGKFSKYWYVEWFGAKGDGVTDDSAAINLISSKLDSFTDYAQDALNDFYVVVFGNTRYKINHTVKFIVRYLKYEVNATFYCDDLEDDLAVNIASRMKYNDTHTVASNNYIRGLRIKCSQPQSLLTGKTGVKFRDGMHLDIYDLEVWHFDTGLYFGDRNCYIHRFFNTFICQCNIGVHFTASLNSGEALNFYGGGIGECDRAIVATGGTAENNFGGNANFIGYSLDYNNQFIYNDINMLISLCNCNLESYSQNQGDITKYVPFMIGDNPVASITIRDSMVVSQREYSPSTNGGKDYLMYISPKTIPGNGGITLENVTMYNIHTKYICDGDMGFSAKNIVFNFQGHLPAMTHPNDRCILIKNNITDYIKALNGTINANIEDGKLVVTRTNETGDCSFYVLVNPINASGLFEYVGGYFDVVPSAFSGNVFVSFRRCDWNQVSDTISNMSAVQSDMSFTSAGNTWRFHTRVPVGSNYNAFVLYFNINDLPQGGTLTFNELSIAPYNK